MCGLLGVISHTTGGLARAQLDAFEDMLVMDILRGKDSTGVMGISKDGNEAWVAKAAGHAMGLIADVDYEQFESWAYQKARAVFGHNRAATRGAKTAENAHPFHEGKIVLMHNGTLNTWHSLKTGRTDIEVDSHAIAHALNTEDNFLDVLSELDGAYVLIWQDLKDKVIRIASNGQRPLWFGGNADVTILCSEYGFINAAANRRNIKFEADEQGHAFHAMKANTVVEFSVEDFKAKPRVIEIPRRSYPLATTHNVGSSYTGGTKLSKKGSAASRGENNDGKEKSLYDKYIRRELIFEVDEVESSRGSGYGNWVMGSIVDAAEDINNVSVKMFFQESDPNFKRIDAGTFIQGVVLNVNYTEDGPVVYMSARDCIIMEVEDALVGPPFCNESKGSQGSTSSKEVYKSVNGHRFTLDDTLGWRHGTVCDMCGIDMEHLDYAAGYVELTQGGHDALSLVCHSCHSERIC